MQELDTREKKKIIILGSCVSRVSMLDGNQAGHGTASDQLDYVIFWISRILHWR